MGGSRIISGSRIINTIPYDINSSGFQTIPGQTITSPSSYNYPSPALDIQQPSQYQTITK